MFFMIQTTVKVSGMACSMCEAHINDAVRGAFPVEKVTSSHSKGETVILSQAPLDENALRTAIDATGYTAGIKLLGSKDAKKVYAHTTAAALRAKEGVMKTVTAVREGAEDVYADAKAINECRAEAEAAAVVEDASAEESKAE